jgi:hypothetical protein
MVDRLIKPLNAEQQAVVSLLENALKAAKAGDFTSMAIAYCKPGGYGGTFCGAQATELYFALADLQGQIMDATKNAGGKRPQIVRAQMS